MMASAEISDCLSPRLVDDPQLVVKDVKLAISNEKCRSMAGTPKRLSDLAAPSALSGDARIHMVAVGYCRGGSRLGALGTTGSSLSASERIQPVPPVANDEESAEKGGELVHGRCGPLVPSMICAFVCLLLLVSPAAGCTRNIDQGNGVFSWVNSGCIDPQRYNQGACWFLLLLTID